MLSYHAQNEYGYCSWQPLFNYICSAESKQTKISSLNTILYLHPDVMISSLFRIFSAGESGRPSSKRKHKSAGCAKFLLDWSHNMLSGRSIIRRGRQRRVLSKHIRRTDSYSSNEIPAKARVPRYIYAIVIILACCFISLKLVFTFSVIYYVIKKVFVPPIRAWFTRHYKRSQHTGPTAREKCYYYLDYWISTNP